MVPYAALQEGRQDGEGEGAQTIRNGRKTRCMPVLPRVMHEIPWRVAVLCVVSTAVAAIGAWLLLQDYQTALGPRYTDHFMLCCFDVFICKAYSCPRLSEQNRHG